MNCTRYGLRALALAFAVALTTMAFGATGAQASKHFVVELSLALAKSATFSATQEELFLMRFLGVNLYIGCDKATGTGTLGPETATWTAEFSECQALDSLKNPNELCDIDTISAGGLALAIGNDEVLLLPYSGQPFTTVLALDSAVAEEEELECNLLDTHFALAGSIKTLVLYPNALEESNPTHLEAKLLLLEPVSSLSDLVTFGSNVIHFSGKGAFVLTGAHAGKCWGIEP